MSLRRRLALLLVVALALVQGVTMAVLYARTRAQIESEAQVRLGQAQVLFDQHLADRVRNHILTFEQAVEICHSVEEFTRLAGRL